MSNIDPDYLAQECLEIAQDYGIAHDGWGCFRCNKNGPISGENPA